MRPKKEIDLLDRQIIKIIEDSLEMEDRTAPQITKKVIDKINPTLEEYNSTIGNVRYRLEKLVKDGLLVKEKVMNAWVYNKITEVKLK